MPKTKIDKEHNFESYDFTLTTDGEEVVFYTGSSVDFTILTSGVSADEIKIFGALTTTSNNWNQIFDAAGDNPFTSDSLQQGSCAPFAKIKISKAGSSDSVTGEISFRK